MGISAKERNLEEDIEAFLCSPDGGYLSSALPGSQDGDRHSLIYIEDGSYQLVDGGYTADRSRGIDVITLVNFIQATQPKAWERFEKTCNSDPQKKFAKVFCDAVDANGIIQVLKHGFKHRGSNSRSFSSSRKAD